ncbi:MAG: hypothetical protein M0C28_41875 [Candidatus Moduliflexus flocculans]|nr:hypothetical protein [Candidatus Moduliflexus flocculans]
MEDRGRRHALRAHLRQVRQHEHGLAGHRRVRSQDPLPGHGRADARPLELPRQRRLEVDRRRQDLDQRRARPRATSSTRSRSIPRTPTSSTSPPRASSTTTRWTASAAST